MTELMNEAETGYSLFYMIIEENENKMNEELLINGCLKEWTTLDSSMYNVLLVWVMRGKILIAYHDICVSQIYLIGFQSNSRKFV